MYLRDTATKNDLSVGKDDKVQSEYRSPIVFDLSLTNGPMLGLEFGKLEDRLYQSDYIELYLLFFSVTLYYNGFFK